MDERRPDVQPPVREPATHAPATEKEARLARIIQKLEVKTKKVWDENKELARQLELSQLDCEIAHELAESLKDELKEAQIRVRELEELRDVSAELEASYVADIARLEQECESLRERLESLDLNTQKLESLQLDLAEARRKAKLADLEVRLIKDGAAATLGPLLGPEAQEWLPIVDVLSIDIESAIEKYKQGQISVPKLGNLVAERLDHCLDLPQTYEALDLTAELPGTDSPRWNRVRAELMRRREAASAPEVAEQAGARDGAGPDRGELPKASGEALQELRISVLEAKLLKAQNMADELQELREQLQESHAKHEELLKVTAEMKEQLAQRDLTISHLEMENLPHDLMVIRHNTHVAYLNGVIKQLTSGRPKPRLDELAPPEPVEPLSRLLGNPRVRNLRRMAMTARLGKSAEEARSLAIEQQTRLMLL